jgi:hypothetical protein
MNQTLVILSGAPLNNHNYERMGIQILSQNFNLIYLNCLPLLNRHNSIDKIDLSVRINYEEIISFDQLNNFLKNLQPDYALDFIGPSEEMLKISHLLDKLSIKLIIQNLGPINSQYRLEYWRYRIRHIFKKRHVTSYTQPLVDTNNSLFLSKYLIILKTLFCNLKKKIFKIKLRYINSHVAIVAGKKGINAYTKNAKFIINSPSHDYYKYKLLFKKTGAMQIKSDPAFIVFADDNLTSGLDFKTLRILPPIYDKKLYFMNLNIFFDFIELQYKCPVIIAGHPSDRNRELYSLNFQNREVVFGKTAELILNSALVIIQASTSISFAIQSRKKIISITSNELNNSNIGPQIRSLSKKVGSTYINIDKFSKSSFIEPKVRERKYKNYLENYIAISDFECIHPIEFLSNFLIQNIKE